MATVNKGLAKNEPLVREDVRKSHLDMPKQMTNSPQKKYKKTKPNYMSPRKTYNPVKRTNMSPSLNKSDWSRQSSGYKSPPLCGSAKSSGGSNKFGFSTMQYKKLQIIKTTRQLNMKILLEVTRTMPNRFYTTVMKCLLAVLRIA